MYLDGALYLEVSLLLYYDDRDILFLMALIFSFDRLGILVYVGAQNTIVIDNFESFIFIID